MRDDDGIRYDRERFASAEAADAFARKVLGLDELQTILDRFGIARHDYLGLPPPPPPLRLRLIRGGKCR